MASGNTSEGGGRRRSSDQARPRLILLFSRFPVGTETFLQREVSALERIGADFECWSLWRGERVFGQKVIRRTPLWGLLTLLWWLPFWAVSRPFRCGRILRALGTLDWRLRINLLENLMGLGLGLAHAHRLRREAPPGVVLHAVWASLPATFGWTVHQLTDLPFTFAGHAYDLFEDGGDALIGIKIRSAIWIRTSTLAGQRRFLELGAPPERVNVIRRGLSELPSPHRLRSPRSRLRLLVVGRFVEKMGYDRLASLFDALQAEAMLFEARIIGEGPERPKFERRRAASAWRKQVETMGSQPFSAVEEALAWCDVLVFTGIVAGSGDRAGFPNIIGEAMAVGRPVVATRVGGVDEVLEDGVNGFVSNDVSAQLRALRLLRDNDDLYACVAGAARDWAKREFDAMRNMRTLISTLESRVQAAETARPPGSPR